VLILDRLLIGGIKFVLGKVADAVDQELNDDTALREQLLAAQMRVELGELSDEEFTVIEADLLQRLREIDERRTGGAKGPIEFTRGASAEATFEGDEPGGPEER
jgi:hypothetical protein